MATLYNSYPESAKTIYDSNMNTIIATTSKTAALIGGKSIFNTLWKDMPFLGNVLIIFAHTDINCTTDELGTLAKFYNLNIDYDHKSKHPYLLTKMNSRADAFLISQRSVAIRNMIEVWEHADSYENLFDKIQTNFNSHIKNLIQRNDYTFRFRASSFCKKLTLSYINWTIERFKILPFGGNVNLTNPDVTLQIVEDYGAKPNLSASPKPNHVYFGPFLCSAQRDLLTAYSLDKRYFIGNTSMKPEISFLMANLAHVKTGDLVFDPFVGTGSLLIACAHFGAYVIGSDIDRKELHGYGKSSKHTNAKRKNDECMKTNMNIYGLEKFYVDLVNSDAARSAWRPDFRIDAIITDPPYGVREGARSSIPNTTTSNNNNNNNNNNKGMNAINPCTVHKSKLHQYPISELYRDLLIFAIRHLKPGGHLVFCLPCVVGDEGNLSSLLECFPSFKICNVVNTVLNFDTKRLIVALEKVPPNSTDMKFNNKKDDEFKEISPEVANKINSFRDKYLSSQNASN